MKKNKEVAVVEKSLKIDERELILKTGDLAEQANAAVTAQLGGTIVLATVVAAPLRENLGYFPLTVEYREKLYAGGRIKGSRWVKREGPPSDEATLCARLIDRAIRPLFPKGYYQDVQVVITVLSVDPENDPAILGMMATSAALAISEIPWEGPIGGTRLGLITNGGKEDFVINPTSSELAYSNLEMVVASTKEAVMMIEAGAREVEEKTVLEGIKLAQKENEKIIDLINQLQKEVGKAKLRVVKEEIDKKLYAAVEKEIKPHLTEMINQGVNLQQIGEDMAEKFAEAKGEEINQIVEEIIKNKVRKEILEKGIRFDGRKVDEIRPLTIKVGVLPRTHGSAIFKRGMTQSLTITTLGSPALEQYIESMVGEETKRYIHHYNMPPYATGETAPFRGPGRREIGHGSLAEKALEPVIPSEKEFPYTIRVVSEIMSSNGSTSMAATCGSTLSLMDAGVPIKAPVVGISIGLISDKKSGKYITLTDITGLEDGCGDMDFKVAGTLKGVTAIQLDVKATYLTREVFEKALEEAKKARVLILEKIHQVIPHSRKSLSKYAPKVVIVQIDREKIGEVIGPGGRMIRKIIEETGAAIDVEDNGEVMVTGPNQESVDKAVLWVQNLTREPQVGEVFEGEVKRIQPFGAFVEILPGKDGLVHISRMGKGYVNNPHDIVKIGDKVKVKLINIDDLGRLDLSMNLEDKPGVTRRPASVRRPS